MNNVLATQEEDRESAGRVGDLNGDINDFSGFSGFSGFGNGFGKGFDKGFDNRLGG